MKTKRLRVVKIRVPIAPPTQRHKSKKDYIRQEKHQKPEEKEGDKDASQN